MLYFFIIALFNVTDSQASEKNKSKVRDRLLGTWDYVPALGQKLPCREHLTALGNCLSCLSDQPLRSKSDMHKTRHC